MPPTEHNTLFSTKCRGMEERDNMQGTSKHKVELSLTHAAWF